MAFTTREGFELSPSQETAHSAVMRGENVFITGSAGNGKSVLTREITTDKTLVVAPTGIAAVNVNGITAHKAFKLPTKIPSVVDHRRHYNDLEFLNQIDRLVISEAGMLRVDYLELIDNRLKLHRRCKEPFGGVQVVLEGDFFQLEPIVSYDEKRQFDLNYKEGKFCFASEKSWVFNTCELTHPQRHPNPDQYELLQRLRVGDKSVVKDLADIAAKYNPDDDILKLCCYKVDAERINDIWFDKLATKVKTFIARISGNAKAKDMQAPEVLRLRVGADVVICANDPEATYVNGDRGVVQDIGDDFVLVKLNDGREVVVLRFQWKEEEMKFGSGGLIKEEVGCYEQFPLMHGWAISVHKSQGMTLEAAALDVGKGCFSHGQLYVAYSRVKDLRNLSLVKRIMRSDVIVDSRVKEFYGY